MAIPIPSKYGIIVLRSPRTQRYIDKRISHWNQAYPGAREHLQDDHIAGFPEAMSYPDLLHTCEELEKKGIREGVDFVKTHVEDGVIGPMPNWLQEDEGGTFSMPGTGKEPRRTPRLSPEEREAVRRQELADEKANAMRERNLLSSEAADRWWPELDEAGTQRLLDDAASLVEFVERCRLGGPARAWVERQFPHKRWHIHVIDGYDKELQTAMDWCYRSALTGKTTEAAQAIMAVRRRAGEYVAALERASRTNAVDVECWSAWRQARASGDL
jgi:hypothetical protein